MDSEAAIREAYKQQKHKKCVELIDSASEDIKQSSKYKILKASCLNNIAGKAQHAHQVLDEVIICEPDNAFARYGKGLVFINEAKLEQAVKCFDEAIQLDPSEKMEKARQMKARVLNMMSPKKAQKKVATAPKAAVQKHTIIKTVQESKKQTYACGKCDKSFEQSSALSRHMLDHSTELWHMLNSPIEERRFPCGVCQKSFIQKSDLTRHVAIHSTVANFPCTLCGKHFKTKKNLQCHASRHTVELNFHCEQCGKGFATDRSLSYHVRTHKINRAAKKTVELDSNSEKESSPTQETSDLFEEVEVKDEFEDYEMEVKTEPEETDSSDDGILSSQSLTFGELEPMTEDDSDWSFCVSLLNDLSKMDDEQKLKLRTKTLQTIKEILN